MTDAFRNGPQHFLVNREADFTVLVSHKRRRNIHGKYGNSHDRTSGKTLNAKTDKNGGETNQRAISRDIKNLIGTPYVRSKMNFETPAVLSKVLKREAHLLPAVVLGEIAAFQNQVGSRCN